MQRPAPGIWLSAVAAAVASLGALAAEPNAPQAGQDYYSWQISSGSAKDLEKLYRQYRALPYARIEQRGNLHVLRVGFWPDAKAAQAALAQTSTKGAMVRVAAYKPQAIVQRNWEDGPASSASSASSASAPMPNSMAAAPAAPAPVTPSATNAASPAAPPLPAVRTQPPSASSGAPTLAPRGPAALPSATPSPAPPAATVATSSSTPTASAPAAAPQAPALSPLDLGDMRAFNAQDYALAFDAFMAASDMERALRVAAKAVASLPLDTEWRRKLARLADWTQRPQIAWEHWAYLFQHGDRAEETVTAVLRLAPVAARPELAISAWQVRAARSAPSVAQWQDLYNLYEMADKAKEGAAFFERQYRQRTQPLLLELSAQLAASAGDDDGALRLSIERAGVQPFSLDAALRAVVALVRRDRLREAYALMQTYKEHVPDEATEYWRMLGGIAWDLQETAGAENAYRRYTQAPQAEAGDWSRLIYLVRQRHPGQAAELALDAYRRYRDLDNLLLAFDIYAQAVDLPGQTRLLKQLNETELAQAQKSQRFMVLRALYHQRMGQGDKAWDDFRVALQRDPKDASVAVPALWFLIDTGRKNDLEPMLVALSASALKDSAYWLPFAAANHALDRFRQALPWYAKEVARKPDDGLLLLNYAQALERVQLVGMAARVRRHAFTQLQAKHPEPNFQAPLEAQPELLALAQLTLLNQPGDASLALVRNVVSQLRGLPLEQGQQTRDLVLGWAISKEQFLNARSWMWHNYARLAGKDSSAPVWGQAQVALQLGDTQSTSRLLNEKTVQLPSHARYDAAYALQDWPQALDTAFKGMAGNPIEEPLHDRYRQHAPLHTNYVQLRLAKENLGVLDSSNQQIELRLVLDRKLHLTVAGKQAHQSSSDAPTAPFVPGIEQLADVEVRWLGTRGEVRANVFTRDEMDHNIGARLASTWSWSQRLVLEGSAGQRLDSTDSLPLRVGGAEDALRLGFSYALSKREALRYGTRMARYYTQFGDYLGSGQSHDLELTHRLRTEYPDFRVRLFANQQSYQYDGSVGPQAFSRLAPEVQAAISNGNLEGVRYFLAQGSTTVGACLAMGDNLAGQSVREIYTRALRPFFDLCVNHNSLNGGGYSGALGVAGSVTGEDHLSVRLEQSRGGSGSGAQTKSLVLRYRHYF